MNITEEFIVRFARNSSAVSNGKGLANKNSFSALHISADQTLLFGECKGSGKKPYNCSVDFTDEEKPIPRCSCPSRQIPCKHVVGLLYSRLLKKDFTESEIPEDVVLKRDKIKKRETKKQSEEKTPSVMTKQKATAAAKKCAQQLEGIILSENILKNIIKAGLHSIDKNNSKSYLLQIKELGNYYINGIQASMTNLLLESERAVINQDFTRAIDSVNFVHHLLKKSKIYLESKMEDYKAFPEMTLKYEDAMLNSPIEEMIGYAWKISELKEKGLFIENAELLQFSFECYDEEAKKQSVDEGCWMDISSGRIFVTKNYRPFKAKKYIKQEDSVFQMLLTSEAYIYPGYENPRIRWDKSTLRECVSKDFKHAKNHGNENFAEIIKKVKNQIKDHLAEKNPVFAVKVNKLVESDEEIAIEDKDGNQILLRFEEFGFLLKKLSREQLINQTLICRFYQDLKNDKLYAVPLSVINDENIIRFMY